MRQANSTIRGYLYQFNKSIFEVLSANDDDVITLEGIIEDIDIESPNNTTTIQCKYHEDQKYQMSSIAAPILEMICHYHQCAAIGKSMSYILYAYFSDNVAQINKNDFEAFINSTTNQEILLTYFHQIYTIQDASILQIANKARKTRDDKEKLLRYYEKKRKSLTLCVDLGAFWGCFRYENAEQYDVLCKKNIDKFSEIVDKEIAKNLYYPNAFSFISNLSAKSDVADRKLTKKQLLRFLEEQESLLITQWTLVALDKTKLLKSKKKHLSAYFSSNAEVRAFIFSDKFIEANADMLIEFIHAYIDKYFKKTRLQKPPIFIFGDNSKIFFYKTMRELYKYQKYVSSGIVGDIFVEDDFVNNVTCTDRASCKMTLLQNATSDLFERCHVNQLYIVGNVNKEFPSLNYVVEKIDVENVSILKYLVDIEKTLED